MWLKKNAYSLKKDGERHYPVLLKLSLFFNSAVNLLFFSFHLHKKNNETYLQIVQMINLKKLFLALIFENYLFTLLIDLGKPYTQL